MALIPFESADNAVYEHVNTTANMQLFLSSSFLRTLAKPSREHIEKGRTAALRVNADNLTVHPFML